MNRIDRVLVSEGDQVTDGQLLAELADVRVKDAAVLQAQTAIAVAQATLSLFRAGGRPSEIIAWLARFASLASREVISRQDAARALDLVTTGAGAQAVAEKERAAAERPTADRSEAHARLSTLTEQRPEDVTMAESRVSSGIAALIRARADAAIARVYAPVQGQVPRIFARPGDLVRERLLDLADLDVLESAADVCQTDVPRVRVGTSTEVIVPGDPKHYVAAVRRTCWHVHRTTQAGEDPVAAIDARTIEVRPALDIDTSQALRQRINMQVQVAIRP